jgi:hypothetical protein
MVFNADEVVGQLDFVISNRQCVVASNNTSVCSHYFKVTANICGYCLQIIREASNRRIDTD